MLNEFLIQQILDNLKKDKQFALDILNDEIILPSAALAEKIWNLFRKEKNGSQIDAMSLMLVLSFIVKNSVEKNKQEQAISGFCDLVKTLVPKI